MLPFRTFFKQRKDRISSATPGSRVSSDLPPRVSRNKDRARSEAPESNLPANGHGKKRKISMVEYDSETSTAYSSKAGLRKHKTPKRIPTPSLPGSGSGTTTMARKPESLHSKTVRGGAVYSGKAAGRGISEHAHSTKKENREDWSCLKENMDVKSLEKKLIGLQKEVDRTQKAYEEQRKTVDDLRRELLASNKTNRKQTNCIDKLKSANKKWEDQLNMIQENLQCQICLELLSIPHTLIPCGHVFCQSCLQNWFRSAPRQDEVDVEAVPTIWRMKTCPCCRSKVHRKPIPLFVLKNAISIFKSNEQADKEDIPSDPWEGIFPTNLDFADQDGRDHSETDGDTHDESFSSAEERSFIVVTDSEVDDTSEESEGSSLDSGYFDEILQIPPYAPARFRTQITRDLYPDIPADILRLIQRGATYSMVLRYNMRYAPDEGIVAWTDGGAEVYLGWNILVSGDDAADGRGFMEWVERNIHEEPERWLHEEGVGHPVFRRRVYLWSRNALLTPGTENESGREDEDSDGDSYE